MDPKTSTGSPPEPGALLGYIVKGPVEPQGPSHMEQGTRQGAPEVTHADAVATATRKGAVHRPCRGLWELPTARKPIAPGLQAERSWAAPAV